MKQASRNSKYFREKQNFIPVSKKFHLEFHLKFHFPQQSLVSRPSNRFQFWATNPRMDSFFHLFASKQKYFYLFASKQKYFLLIASVHRIFSLGVFFFFYCRKKKICLQLIRYYCRVSADLHRCIPIHSNTLLKYINHMHSNKSFQYIIKRHSNTFLYISPIHSNTSFQNILLFE